MKKLEIKTSKSRFVVIDNNQDDAQVIQFLKDIPYGSYINRIKLSEITEEQASEIVESHKNCKRYYYEKSVPQTYYNSALNCLHSLLKSKGIHLFKNPHPRRYIIAMTDKGIIDTTEKLYLEAEEKTFYNPYIFKI